MRGSVRHTHTHTREEQKEPDSWMPEHGGTGVTFVYLFHTGNTVLEVIGCLSEAEEGNMKKNNFYIVNYAIIYIIAQLLLLLTIYFMIWP